jgi:hypothetical protein
MIFKELDETKVDLAWGASGEPWQLARINMENLKMGIFFSMALVE